MYWEQGENLNNKYYKMYLWIKYNPTLKILKLDKKNIYNYLYKKYHNSSKIFFYL
jgi:hypothetical protein